MYNLSAICRITTKELAIFFYSPMAYLFIGAFATLNLFIFFWVEAFFVRNISDLRPLFSWMPILLIFLCSALTMRMWSEEIRHGTIEHILTQPIGLAHFIIGKFLACVVMLFIALLISLPLAFTVSSIGDLDWGPVFSGYLASFLLGSAYISIGLFLSSRSENQIVSLITSVAVCGILYLFGSDTLTNLFSNSIGELLRLLGTGSRFDSITRGIIDFRDFYYYLSLIILGLTLNLYSLEKSRWHKAGKTKSHTLWYCGMALFSLNILFANFWMNQLPNFRLDTTQGKIYTLSKISERQIKLLQEPLLIRGYFSNKTHPLLAPLIPQITDLLKEYEIAGKGKIQLQIIDPAENAEAEKEANDKYGIKATPFQIQDRYQASVVNSYFNILLQYGDEFEVLSFQDLIDIKQQSEKSIEVLLRNPEYDLTNTIRKIVQTYRNSGDIFSGIKDKLNFTAYISSTNKLPKALQEFQKIMQQEVNTLVNKSKGKIAFQVLEPEANGGTIAQHITENFGFRPMIASILDPNQFYFYLTLQHKDQVSQIPPGDLTADSFKKSLESAIKRFSQGFTKTIGVLTSKPTLTPYNRNPPSHFSGAEKALENDFNVNQLDLQNGVIPADKDLILLLGVNTLNDKELFAIDQYLMRGGTVIISAAPFSSSLRANSLVMQPQTGQLFKWLEHHGLTMEKQLILDERNAPFAFPVKRLVGGFTFEELRLVPYPYFVDVRQDSLNDKSLITSKLNRAIFAWASPINIRSDLSTNHQVLTLAKTSDKAWKSPNINVLPKINQDGSIAFLQPSDERQQFILGVSVQGQFKSYFTNKKSPLLADRSTKNTSFSGLLNKSAESAKIILFSSNDFLKDQITNIISSANRSPFNDNTQLLVNAVESSIDKSGLQSIRSRGNFNRILLPMDTDEQQFLEYLNYLLALLFLLIIGIVQRLHHRRHINKLIHQIQI